MGPTTAEALLMVGAARQMRVAADGLSDAIRPAPAPDALAGLMQAGQDALAGGRLRPALALFRQALRAVPDHGQAHLHLAVLTGELGWHAESLAHWLALTQAMPSLTQPFFEAARLHATAGAYDRAQAMLARMQSPATDAFWIAEIGRIRAERATIVAGLRARLAEDRTPDAALVTMLGQLGFVRIATRLLPRMRDAGTEAAAIAWFRLQRRDDPAGAADALAATIPPEARSPALRALLAAALFAQGRTHAAAAVLQGAADRAAQEMLFRIRLIQDDTDACLAIAGAMMDARPADTLPCQFALSALLADGMLPMGNEGAAAPAHPVVPSVLLHYWDQPTPPDDVRAVMDAWTTDGAWQAVLFDRDRAAAWIAAHHGPAQTAAFARCHHAAMRSDYFRLCHLVIQGGVYLDVDEAPVGDPLALRAAIGGAGLLVAMLGSVLPYANNALIAARPGHPVIAAALEQATARLQAPHGDTHNIWETTGPGLLTRALVRHLRAHGADGIALLTETGWRRLCRPETGLGYKSTQAGNWRLASGQEQ